MSSSVSWVMNFCFTKSIIREALNDQKLGILWIMARVYRFFYNVLFPGLFTLEKYTRNQLLE